MNIESVGFLSISALFLFVQRYLHLQEIKKLKEIHKEEKSISKEIVIQSSSEKSLSDEIRHLQNIINDMKIIVQDASLIKNDILTNIRHEIRTPMNAILAFSQMIEAQSENANIKSYARDILKSGTNLLHLLNNIIEMSEMDSGSFKLTPSATDVNFFMDSVLEVYSYEAQKKNIKFIVERDKKMPDSLMLDTLRVKEILDNLLSNALKFTATGEVKFLLVLDAFDESKYKADISFIVKDTGIGILKVNQEKIFEIFRSKEINNKAQYQGTGLGLAINKRLASLMNGSLELESELQEGTTFTLALKNVDVVLLSKTYDVDESNLNFSSIKQQASIVVIDDSQNTLDLLKESFASTEVSVFAFASLRDAIATLRNTQVDMIMIDRDVLSMDDSAAAKALKNLSKAPVVSLVNETLHKVELHKDGVQPVTHLKKPLSKVDLFRVTLRILNAKDIYFESGFVKELEQVDGLSFEASVEASKLYFRDALKEVDILLVEALTTNDLNTIEMLGNAIYKLSLVHKLESLTIFSTQLLLKIDSFDIMEITKMLKEYDKKASEFKQKRN